MKSLVIFLTLGMSHAAVAGDSASSTINSPSAPANLASSEAHGPTAYERVAASVRDIAEDPVLSVNEKESLIGRAIQGAVSLALSKVDQPGQRIKIALDYAVAAASAAPDYAAIIEQTISALPQLASINGAKAQVSAAIKTAAASAVDPDSVEVALAAPNPPTTTKPARREFGADFAPETFVVSRATPPPRASSSSSTATP